MKKQSALLLAGALAATMMAACGSSGAGADSSKADSSSATAAVESSSADAKKENSASQNSGGKGGVTLSLYGNADDLAKPYMKKIISMWEEASGNTIEVQGLDTANAETIALTKFTTGDIPDLYIHFGNANLKNFNPKENFVDWTDAEWVSDIEDSMIRVPKVSVYERV